MIQLVTISLKSGREISLAMPHPEGDKLFECINNNMLSNSLTVIECSKVRRLIPTHEIEQVTIRTSEE